MSKLRERMEDREKRECIEHEVIEDSAEYIAFEWGMEAIKDTLIGAPGYEASVTDEEGHRQHRKFVDIWERSGAEDYVERRRYGDAIYWAVALAKEELRQIMGDSKANGQSPIRGLGHQSGGPFSWSDLGFSLLTVGIATSVVFGWLQFVIWLL